MKRTKLSLLGLVLAAAVGVGFIVQRPDLAGNLTGQPLIEPGLYANTATTGTWADIANYNSIAFLIDVGAMQNTDTIYLVFQDSSSGLAVAAFDSVTVGAADDSTHRDLGYYRNRRFVRALLRASGGAADSNAVSVSLVGTTRSR